MKTQKPKKYYAFTPGGTLCLETGAYTKQGCIQKLLNETAHMPYKNFEEMEKRGYEIELLDNLN